MSVKNKPIRIATAETTTSENELLALGAADISRYKQKETKEQRPAQDQLTFFFPWNFFPCAHTDSYRHVTRCCWVLCF